MGFMVLVKATIDSEAGILPRRGYALMDVRDVEEATPLTEPTPF